MNKKNVVIFGSGGHGWFPLFELLKDQRYDFTSLMLPVDWGGSTGVIGRLLELNDFKLNFELHGSKDFPILPWGDFNKFVMAYMDKNYSNILNFRSDNFVMLWDRFAEFAIGMNLDKKLSVDFKSYLEKYIQYLNINSYLLSTNSPTCLGNLWNQYLFFVLGEQMMDFYIAKGVFSENIKHSFVTKKRLVLVGQSIGYNKSNKVVGEDMIDLHTQSILPDSLKIENINGHTFFPSKDVLNCLKNADYIIIPNGSITNWLPLININTILDIIQKKSEENRVFWMVNLFKTRNEFNASIYYKYMIHRGIKALPLGPKSAVDLTYQMAIDYYKQSKELNNLSFSNNVFNLIDENNYTSIEGLKHDPRSVYKYFKKVLT